MSARDKYVQFMVERTRNTPEDYADCITLEECKRRSISLLKKMING